VGVCSWTHTWGAPASCMTYCCTYVCTAYHHHGSYWPVAVEPSKQNLWLAGGSTAVGGFVNLT
jgi:hypothetical protein